MSGAVCKDVLALKRAGASYGEIAALTGLSLSAVRNMLARDYAAEQERKMRATPKKKRTCLCCGAPFMSWGAGNRLCQRCRAKDDYMLFAA